MAADAVVGAMMTTVTSTRIDSSSTELLLERLAALADPIRLAVVSQLSHGARCVCDLQEAVDAAPNLLSYHLKVLREAGIIAGTRRGRWIDYALVDGALDAVRRALPQPGPHRPGCACNE